jgi:hypothetical protein
MLIEVLKQNEREQGQWRIQFLKKIIGNFPDTDEVGQQTEN